MEMVKAVEKFLSKVSREYLLNAAHFFSSFQVGERYVYIYLNPLKKGKFVYNIKINPKIKNAGRVLNHKIRFSYKPFYVGRGQGKRCLSHSNNKRHYNGFLLAQINWIKKKGSKPIIKVYPTKQADFLETVLIGSIGTIKNSTGPLLNLYGTGVYGRSGPILDNFLVKRREEHRDMLDKGICTVNVIFPITYYCPKCLLGISPPGAGLYRCFYCPRCRTRMIVAFEGDSFLKDPKYFPHKKTGKTQRFLEDREHWEKYVGRKPSYKEREGVMKWHQQQVIRLRREIEKEKDSERNKKKGTGWLDLL